ncbi:MAG: phenylalanine--tRNA ligase subunit alpha [Alphaproteobacteria bacterium]|nr:phenylalanine--tRNA ligase subunit alpha [Alphaproteobacteria bacterium]MCZ6885689.1 phenylalanine--tRNA ligase subunit alpha [Alphaproteobacteria bacterium]
MTDLEQLRLEIIEAAAVAASLDVLEILRVEALGRNGSITARMKELGALPAEERKAAGQALNAVKTEVSDAIDARKAALEALVLESRLAQEGIDVTLPVRGPAQGFIHPISQTMDELMAIFGEMGFRVAEGPDIEDDFHNFTALNIPQEHPARQMHDTFYLPEDGEGTAKLLRTHTSPVQIRTMMATPPPHRIVAPGRTYRCDSDITHTPMFHQIEGLVIDKSTHMGHLKGCLEDFCRAYFEVDDLPLRFRPSYFPFTEPSCEVDIGCSRSGGKLSIGAGEDWLEILGAGMVHPNVLANCGLDADEWQGFAFGLGVERIAMLKYGIPDLRTFFESDLRWLRHYGFAALDQPSLVGGLAR